MSFLMRFSCNYIAKTRKLAAIVLISRNLVFSSKLG